MFIVDDEQDDIQEQAANVDETEITEPVEEVKQPTSPVEPVDQTKAFAARLKEEKAKAKLEAREEIAKSFGYNSWSEYADAQTNNKLLDSGFDPETVRPVLKDIIKGDPEYQEAMKYKAEKEALEKELFATNSIKALNEKFGTAYSSVDELDPETIRLWNAGTPLANAYAAVNWESIRDAAVKKASVPKETGKSHLKQVPGGGGQQTSAREFTKEELNAFAKMYGYTEAQVKEYMNRTNNK